MSAGRRSLRRFAGTIAINLMRSTAGLVHYCNSQKRSRANLSEPGGGGGDGALTTMCLSISTQGKQQHSKGALDHQQLLTTEGSKKSRQAGTQPSDGESEKCCYRAAKKKQPPQYHRHKPPHRTIKPRDLSLHHNKDGDTLSMCCSCKSLWSSTWMNCNCGTSTVFSTTARKSARTGMSTTLSKNWTIPTSEVLSNTPRARQRARQHLVQELPKLTGSRRFSRRAATVGARLSSPRPALVELARPAQQGHRSPYRRKCGEVSVVC